MAGRFSSPVIRCAGGARRVWGYSEAAFGPGLASYGGALYDAWCPNILGSPIDYFVRS